MQSFSVAKLVRAWSDRRAWRLCRQLTHALLDLLFPQSCAGCRAIRLTARQGMWCEKCLGELPWITSPKCWCCGRPFIKSAAASDSLCGACILEPPPFDSARSAVIHTGVVRERINQLKFSGRTYWVPPLAQLLADTFRTERYFVPDFIVAVPLHKNRLRQRGFNQAGLIAQKLGRMVNLPRRFDVLIRSRWTEPQTRLSRSSRLRNVRNAFTVVKPCAVEGRCVLLVDDVFTTGSTLRECGVTLKNAGASAVHALTVSRAVPEAMKDWENP